MLRHIRLLVLDLDYLVFDCSRLKVQSLRQSLISFADTIPLSARLPDAADIEDGYLTHGFRWPLFVELGLNEEQHEDLRHAYAIHEERLINSGAGQLYPGVSDFLSRCRQEGVALALGAEASRDYLLTVTERYHLEDVFEMSLCTEEFGVGSCDEMLDEIMHHAEVNPSECAVLGTLPSHFRAAHDLELVTIGCGWGIRQHGGLHDADLQALTVAQLYPALRKADELSAQYM